MARSLRVQFPGAIYHVTCRGNGRRRIFVDADDRLRFLELLKTSGETYQVVLYAYILMTNHFHVLVQTSKANLSEFMRHFNICYTGWFNSRHGRCGHLYQGRYKAFLVDADAYLLEVSRYLHLNVVRIRKLRSANYEQLCRHALAYRWSSLAGYVHERKAEEPIDYRLILSMSNGRRGYRDFVLDGLKQGMRNPFEDVQRGLILGSEEFVSRLKREKKLVGSRSEQPSYRRLTDSNIGSETILDLVSEVLGMERERILSRQGDGVARGIASELLYRYSGLKQGEIGQLLGGIAYSGVSRLRSRLKQRMDWDPDARQRYQRTEQRLRDSMSNVKI